MAIQTFNSLSGFSVGGTYTPIIDSSGNIFSNNISANGNLTVGGQINILSGVISSNTIVAGQLTAAQVFSNGNISGSNIVTAGKIAGGELSISGNIIANGNITGTYLYGDGSNITNLPSGNYSNSNVANYLPTYTGTIQSNVVVLGDGVNTISQASWFKTQTNSISNAILYEVSSNSVSSLDFNITATSGNNRQVVKIMSVVINNTYEYSEYGSLTLGNDLGNFVVDLVAGNLQLYVDPFTSNVIDYTVVVNAYS